MGTQWEQKKNPNIPPSPKEEKENLRRSALYMEFSCS
jgi:hypothetical protein